MTTAPPPISDNNVPAERLDQLELVDHARSLLADAGNFVGKMGRPGRISATGVLLAMVARSFSETGGSIGALAVGLKDRFEEARGAFVGDVDESPPAETVELTPTLWSVLERAVRIAETTTGRPRIRTRHLVAALLLEPPSDVRAGIQSSLGLDASAAGSSSAPTSTRPTRIVPSRICAETRW